LKPSTNVSLDDFAVRTDSTADRMPQRNRLQDNEVAMNAVTTAARRSA
jgi:hypothetical protein